MGAWKPWQWPTEPPEEPAWYGAYVEWLDDERVYEQESLDERAEQDECVEEDDERDWGAWLEDGERPVPNTGS